jgi:hypothetical protein
MVPDPGARTNEDHIPDPVHIHCGWSDQVFCRPV